MSLSKALFGAFAATIAFAAPAAADYTILHDVAYPSVVYVEFDGAGATPAVIDAPSAATSLSTDPALPAISSGEGGSTTAPAEENQAAQDNRTVEERVEDKVAEIESMTSEELDNAITDNMIENQILDDAELR